MLLYNTDKVRSTTMEVCWLMESKDTDFFKFSKQGTLPHFLYFHKTDPNNPCVVFDANGPRQRNDFHFFMIGILLHMPILRTLTEIYGLDIFYNPTPFYTLSSVIYLSKKSSDKIRKEIDNWAIIYLERGYSLKYNCDSHEALKSTYRVSDDNIYNSVEDFINKNTFIHNLMYEKFKVYFHFYLIFIAFYSVLNLFVILTRLQLSTGRTLRIRICSCFTFRIPI